MGVKETIASSHLAIFVHNGGHRRRVSFIPGGGGGVCKFSRLVMMVVMYKLL